MKIKKQLSFTILAVIISTINIEAQQNEKNTLNHRKEILSWLAEYNVPAVGIGIIKDGKLSECKVYGELRKGIPANDSAIFSIASVTKTIVAMVTLKLVEAGQWDLDEPLYKYWIDPDVAGDVQYKKLTTRHVLSHQSGLPNWRSDLNSKKLEFLFEPGTKYQYSGEGFEYLKKALEQKLHKSLEELSDSILFTPLGMKSTKYHWGDKIDESRFAFKHNSEGKVYEEGIQKYASAAYGLLTTVEDYSKFGIDVINRAGLSNDLFNEMISSQINIKKNIDQGLGWQIIRNLPNGEYALMHEGGSNGVSTLVVLLPISKRGVVVFTNGDKGDKVYLKALETFINVGKTIIENMNIMSYDPDKIKIVEISNDILATYTGSYLIPSFQMSVKIINEGNLLKLETPYAKMVLYAESETKFFLKDDDLRIEFIKNENKNITGFMMTFKGAKPEFSKKTE
jgi:CubicO group peptidase (beta-lactamase class C family)